MFFQQLRDFDERLRRDARLARVNVELEQSAHTIDLWTTDGQVQRSLAVIVDRILIDAVQCTQQLTCACVVRKWWCEMQRRPTIFVKKNKDFGLWKTDIFYKNSSQKLTRRCLARSQSRPKQSASEPHRCARGKLLDVLVAHLQIDTRWDWNW